MWSWLITNTTYGAWLPGDERGSVTRVRERRPEDPATDARFPHNIPGEPYEVPLRGLQLAARAKMKGPPVSLTAEQAAAICEQFQETSRFRDWTLHAAAVMANHFHIVMSTLIDLNPDKICADYKAYASRRLNRDWGAPESGEWWTAKGSVRKLGDASALANAIVYVTEKQEFPLVVWCRERGRLV
ncbi:MAG: transposase [Planctomycetaceae bacterium]|nr:transposase [Planctomycetaceae bacterium]